MKRMLMFLIVLFALAVFNAQTSSAIIMVDFNPNPLNVEVNNSFVVDIVADIPDTEALIGWELDLSFNNTLVSVDNVTVGAPWDLQVSNDGDGLGGIKLPPDNVFGTDVLLARLDLTCLGVGKDNLSLSANVNEGFFLDPMLGGGKVDWQLNRPGTINQSIPEPSTMLLFGSVLMVLWIGRKRIKR